MNIDFSQFSMQQITECCNEHDVCYGTCNAKKDVCDRKFKFCLSQYCERVERRDGSNSKIFLGLVSFFINFLFLNIFEFVQGEQVCCMSQLSYWDALLIFKRKLSHVFVTEKDNLNKVHLNLNVLFQDFLYEILKYINQ
jgi:hypothetical protein